VNVPAASVTCAPAAVAFAAAAVKVAAPPDRTAYPPDAAPASKLSTQMVSRSPITAGTGNSALAAARDASGIGTPLAELSVVICSAVHFFASPDDGSAASVSGEALVLGFSLVADFGSESDAVLLHAAMPKIPTVAIVVAARIRRVRCARAVVMKVLPVGYPVN
jgi:hypothetical protein